MLSDRKQLNRRMWTYLMEESRKLSAHRGRWLGDGNAQGKVCSEPWKGLQAEGCSRSEVRVTDGTMNRKIVWKSLSDTFDS